MEVFARELQLPRPPEDLVLETVALLQDPAIQTKYLDSTGTYGFISLWDTGLTELRLWLEEYIGEAIWCLSYFPGDVRVHKDPRTRHRLIYILDPGGKNVRTNFYEDDGETLISSERLEQGTWTLLNAARYHEVVNTEPGQFRLAISARVHSHTWGVKPGSFVSQEYRFEPRYKPLQPVLISRLEYTLELCDSQGKFTNSAYQRVSLVELGLGFYEEYLCRTIQPGRWVVERITNSKDLVPSDCAVELRYGLGESQYEIRFQEDLNDPIHSARHIGESGHWYLDVANCRRRIVLIRSSDSTIHYNLVCELLGKSKGNK